MVHTACLKAKQIIYSNVGGNLKNNTTNLKISRRQKFLKEFLRALGAKEILWTDETENSISGTVIYDLTDLEERQDFIWHMTEQKVPSEQVKDLLAYLTTQGLIDIDKLKVPATKIEIPNIDNETKERLFDELFDVQVNMVDEGEETDYYFIHD